MKKGEARRSELLAAAERLFYTKGYEGTSVQDILDEVHFSKGGFYHHFDSKLAVLEAICEMRAQACCARARQAAARAEGSAVDRLNAVFHDSAILASGHNGFISLMIQVAYREDGALMREKMKRSQMEGLQPVIGDILRDGVRGGDFFLSDVEAYAALLLRMYLQFTDEVAFLLAEGENEDALMQALIRCLNAYRTAVERVLSAPFGSVVLFEARELQQIAQAILRERVRRRADALLQA